jgi:hypothetical protein
VPGWLQGNCLFAVAAGYALALWAMRVNRFFSSIIRIKCARSITQEQIDKLFEARSDAISDIVWRQHELAKVR